MFEIKWYIFLDDNKRVAHAFLLAVCESGDENPDPSEYQFFCDVRRFRDQVVEVKEKLNHCPECVTAVRAMEHYQAEQASITDEQRQATARKFLEGKYE